MDLSDITQGSYEVDRRIGSVRVVRTIHEPRTMLERHAHARACFTLVLRGEFVEDVPEGRFRCTRGALLFKPAFEFHRDLYGERGARSLLLELPADDDLGIPLSRLPHRTRRVEVPGAVRLAARIAHEVSGPGPDRPRADVPRALELESDVFELLDAAFGDRSGRSREEGLPLWVVHVYERLSDAPTSAPALTDLAREEGVHADHLIRVFRRVYGSTPGVFVRERRARLAAQRVTARDRPLGEIAVACGYADQSHMTREFRRFLECTPGSLRRAGAPPG